MNSFSDFGIKTGGDRKIFEVPQISISEILNCPIEVIDFIPDIKTAYGGERYILKIKHEDKEYKFFTTASQIKEALDKIPKDKFPFSTTIKIIRFGNNSKTYFFT